MQGLWLVGNTLNEFMAFIKSEFGLDNLTAFSRTFKDWSQTDPQRQRERMTQKIQSLVQQAQARQEFKNIESLSVLVKNNT